MNRREVIRKFLMGGTVLVVVPGFIESCSKNPATDTLRVTGGTTTNLVLQVDLSLPENDVLNTTGNSKIFGNVIVINTGTGFVALTSICTHEGCIVQYNPVSGNLECPCHGSKFQISGNVLQGPAKTALYSFIVTVANKIITVTYK